MKRELKVIITQDNESTKKEQGQPKIRTEEDLNLLRFFALLYKIDMRNKQEQAAKLKELEDQKESV